MPDPVTAISHPDPPLRDGVIMLRAWRAPDVPAIVDICSDEISGRYTTVPVPYTQSDAREWLAGHSRALADGASIAFAVVEPPADAPLGSIGLTRHGDSVAEVGYITAPTARGRGLMPRAVALLTGWAFATLGIERVELATHPDNVASIRVAEKCGFIREGVLRSYGVQRGRRVDLVMHSRLPGDPPPG
jgi:RimJ/RimL family protein N-acetyltransferase